MSKERPFSSPLSEEVKFYLESREYLLDEVREPLFRTPEPVGVDGAVFDPAEVDRKIQVLASLRHTKGKWAGQPIVPTASQVAHVIAPVFGWRRWDEDAGRYVRVINDTYIEMTRKSAKTTLVASLAMILAFADDEPGAEVVFGAASRDQAKMAFKPLKSTVDFSPTMKAAGIQSTINQIRQDSTNSSIWVASSRGELTHGANIHGGLIDELHVHRDDGLLEAVESGTGARDQPLVFIITTADDGSITSPYAQRREMIEQLAKGILHIPSTYGVVFAARPTSDPMAESTWEEANILYPTTPTRRFMINAAQKAASSPRAMSSFKRLHLGIRDAGGESFFSLLDWDANEQKRLTPDDMAGRVAVGGIDLANTSDLTALAWLFPRDNPMVAGFDVLCDFWIPEAALAKLDEKTVGTASRWVDEGWLKLTPGDVTDYSFIEKALVDQYEKFDVVGVGFDPWNSTYLVNNLTERGLRMEKVRQGFLSLSAPLKELERQVKNKSLNLMGNPVLRWNADNLRPAMDANGNIKPDKKRSKDKIDGISAVVTALFVAMHTVVQASAYESGGVETI